MGITLSGSALALGAQAFRGRCIGKCLRRSTLWSGEVIHTRQDAVFSALDAPQAFANR
jgi:hypothetical protein